MQKQGTLSINSENIFPIIKKWLYSDHDIFMRELISNGCDAITKLKKLDMMGEYSIPEDNQFKIRVVVNSKDKTIKFIDNGIGMTAQELDEYINQIAFSGAQAFLEKYKDKTNEDQIIGHFGLGFYSAFMVADRVAIDTLSWQDGAAAVHWESEEGTSFEMADSQKSEVGTEITLYLNEDSYEFSNEYRAREIIEKYCAFMPVEIYLEDEAAEPQYETIEKDDLKETDEIVETVVEEAKTEEKENEDGTKETVEISPRTEKYKINKRPVPLNDTTPLWNKHPNECTEEEYKEFYRKVFMDFKEPLFWIHLNMDYPFNLKGILYFPKINMEYESIEGTIKLYNNQVFIADNIKEVIPEFLMLLKGVIDCPDLPLNVSRSALQNDGFVKKISDYISKKVADKLSGMCKTDRENYEKYWDDINPFIKFGCLKDEKFAEKMNDYILFKNLDGKYLTLKDCLEENEKEHKNQVFYVTDEKEQGQYIHMFREAGIDAVILKHNIDTPFISHLEMKNKDVKFVRIDADLTDAFKSEETGDEEKVKKQSEELTALFKKALNNENLSVQVEHLKNDKIASMMTMSEEGRRMQEMMKMYSMYGMDPSMFGGKDGENLVLNLNHPLVQYLAEHQDGGHTTTICEQLYDLAQLGHGTLSPEQMTKFISRSNEIMLLLAK
ncbi:molecular chaperone HtpG [Cuneatibacter caecimuris]|uniref:Molecular chaperone HtpG n=1 Tax=Cuneatibacter caecimuris TaxID=1796618 RepID=A0A4Q7P2V0_9FIRM|nr:molecular chaperone HtpG [Cuneatibacter caecimuris]RZS92992.1 molecular chaperone HtpG [Cuneatibacter caecimuris]